MRRWLTGLMAFCLMALWLMAVFVVFQVVFDVVDREDAVSCLLSLLHRADQPEAERWSVKAYFPCC